MCSLHRELVVEAVVVVVVKVAVVEVVNVWGWSDPLLVGCTWGASAQTLPSCEHVVTSCSDAPP